MKQFGLVLMALLVVGPVFSGSLADVVQLNADLAQATTGDPWQDARQEKSLQEREQRLTGDLLANPDFIRDVVERRLPLTPEFKARLVGQVRFAVTQDGRQDLRDVLAALEKQPVTKGGVLTKDNLLGIPLRTGNLELSYLFVKRRGQITRCDKTRFSAILDTYRVEVTPDPTKPGRVIAKFSGDPQLPQQPVGAVVTTDGRTARVVAEDGTTMQLSYLGGVKYTFSSNKLSVTLNVKFTD